MGEINRLLRFLVPADKEAKITAVTADPVGPHTKFTSQLTSGHTRKYVRVFNNSASGSGDAYWGYGANISPSGESMALPKAETRVLPIADTSNIDIYFCSASGEHGDLRIEELA